MTQSIVRTTRDRAATLARMIEAGDSGRPLTPAQVGYRPSILVETTGSIPGNSTAQHTVRIVESSGGVPAASRSTMLVRHCGTNTIASGARLMAEYCGQLGYVIQRGGGTPSVGVPAYRYMRIDSELSAEGQGEDTHWEWGTIPSHPLVPEQYRGRQAWTLTADTSSGGTVNASGIRYWDYRLYAYRWKAESWGSGYAGGNPRSSSPLTFFRQPAGYSQYALQVYDWARWGGAFGPIAIGWVYPYWLQMGLSNLSPPAGGVVDQWRTYGVYPWQLDDGSSNPAGVPRWATTLDYQGQQYSLNCAITARKGRVWIDGTDKTGIVTQATIPSFGAQSPASWIGTRLGVDPTKAILEQGEAVTAKSIWHDQWFVFRVSLPDWLWQIGIGKGQYVVAALSPHPTDHIAAIAQGYQSPGVSTRSWTAAFDSQGPDSETSITLPLFGQWTGTAGNSVRWYDGEIPAIVVRKSGLNASPRTGAAVYMPEDSSHYDPLWFASGGQRKLGRWDADAATVFRRVGGHVQSMLLGAPQSTWLDLEGAGDPTGWDANYSDYPSTITVSPA